MIASKNSTNIESALARITQYWTPQIIGQVNDQYVKVAKLKGELMWHSHADEDELFWVVYGELKIQLEQSEITLGPGDLYVIPKGTPHNPVAAEECGIVLIETVTTRHTGDEVSDRTVPIEQQLG
ncbi:cupin domain-containing protein [Pseudomonas abyssi]|uniref:cupin domain-containing protein n=1 Tax=Pseudomonas abyssi TaxID=170540 RepID=UPI003C7AC4E4